jgi:hypothetical protein
LRNDELASLRPAPLVLGEQAENIERKDFTIQERVRIGEAIKQLLGSRQGPCAGRVLPGALKKGINGPASNKPVRGP